MRVVFNVVFQSNPNGSFSPKVVVKIGGVVLSPGVSFTPGVSFSGVDIAKIAGRDLEVEYLQDGSVEIKGHY